MAVRDLPTADVLRQLLDYEPETGSLTWRVRPRSFFEHCTPGHIDRIRNSWNAAWAGRRAGVTDPGGYLMVTVFGQHVGGHRIVWCLHTGEWPSGQIDHINGVRGDNRIANLRDVPRDENQRNMRRSSANTSGVSGVYLCKHTGRWRASITHDGSVYRLGRFTDLDMAKAAVAAKRAELGFAERHGQEGKVYGRWRPTA